MAQFKTGEPRPVNSGRKAGTKNKSTQFKEFVRCEPAQKVVELLEHGNLKDKERLDGWLEICKYFYTKPTEDVNLNFGNNLEIKVITK